MSQECQVCGKKPSTGNQVTIRGKAKYLGGVGTKVTGITKRRFQPNLQSIRVTIGKGTNKRLKVCTQCIRSGAVIKAIRSAPFKLAPAEAAHAKAAHAKAAQAKAAKSKAANSKAATSKTTVKK